MLGQRVETPTNRSFIASSHFKPSILEGQLCYTLDVNEAAKVTVGDRVKSGAGKRNGLLLVIDPGFADQDDDDEVARDVNVEVKTLNLEETREDTKEPKIYLNTLDGYTTFQKGSIAMSALKKMTGTDNYIANKNKDCSVETFEDCQARRFLVEVENQCACVPWSLAAEKMFEKVLILINFSAQM